MCTHRFAFFAFFFLAFLVFFVDVFLTVVVPNAAFNTEEPVPTNRDEAIILAPNVDGVAPASILFISAAAAVVATAPPPARRPVSDAPVSAPAASPTASTAVVLGISPA